MSNGSQQTGMEQKMYDPGKNVSGRGIRRIHRMRKEALQAALIEDTGYQSQQFALIHPDGVVGERLNQ